MIDELIDFQDQNLYWALMQYGIGGLLVSAPYLVNSGISDAGGGAALGVMLAFIYRFTRQVATDWDKELNTWAELAPIVVYILVFKGLGSADAFFVPVLYLAGGAIGFLVTRD